MAETPETPSTADGRSLPTLSPQSRAFLHNVLEELGFVAQAATLLGKRKAPPRNASNRGAFHQIVDAAKFTPRGADAYWDLVRTLEYGCLAAVDADGPEIIAARPPAERAPHHVAVFAKIFATCRFDVLPVLYYLYVDSRTNPAPWKALVDRLQRAARQARTQDTNTFKSALRIFLPVPGRDLFDPPVDIGSSKARRGLAHPQLRLLLMPWRDRSQYPPLTFDRSNESTELSDEAKSINSRIALHKYEPSSKRFPSFCYADGQYDPSSYRRNLFRNVIIVRGLRLLLITRTDANDAAGNRMPSGCIASIHGIYSITPHILAYVIVQMRFAISSLPEWQIKESKNYSFASLYEKVLDAFADDEDDEDLPNWAEETLKWLTQRTFGNVEDPRTSLNDEEEQEQSEDEAIVQRKRRRVMNAPAGSA